MAGLEARLQVTRIDAADLGHALGGVVGHHGGKLVEALGAAFHELAVHQALPYQHVHHAVRERHVRAGAQLQVDIGLLRQPDLARVHHDQLRAALDWVRDGDTFMVTKPDRLARNVTDLLRIVEDLKARNVTVRIMSMGVDTSTATGVLILQVLGAVSQWERSVMLERQRHGIAKAKAEGKYRGRAPTARAKTPEVLRLKAEGQTVAQIAQSVGISRASVYRAFAEAG